MLARALERHRGGAARRRHGIRRGKRRVAGEGGELAGQVIALLLVGMVLGAAIFSVPIAILLTRRDEKRRR